MAVVGNIQSDNEETVRLLKDIAEKNGHVGSKFIPFEVDVSISTQVDALFGSLENSFGENLPVSIIVNSAGIASTQTLMMDTDFEKILDVNLKVFNILYVCVYYKCKYQTLCIYVVLVYVQWNACTNI